MEDHRQRSVGPEWRQQELIREFPGQNRPDTDPDSGKHCDGAEDVLLELGRVIETEIIPRLMLAHQTGQACPVVSVENIGTPSDQDIEEFTKLVLAHDAEVAYAYVEAMRANGMPLETIYLELLTPTAQRLGYLWEEDLCDFTEVTVGLWRLQHVLRDLSPVFQNEVEQHPSGHRILLVPAPGEQHSLGLFMVSEFFRRAGWEVYCEPLASRADLLSRVKTEQFDLVGLSAACETRLEQLTTDISVIREASCNRAVKVMVGGPIFIQNPDYVALVGADGTASDAQQAPVQAAQLLAQRSKNA